MINIILVLSVAIVLLLLCSVLLIVYFLRLVDKLTDKLLARSFTDYTYGQILKEPEREDKSVSHSDEAEAAIEQARLKRLGKEIEEVGSIPPG